MAESSEAPRQLAVRWLAATLGCATLSTIASSLAISEGSEPAGVWWTALGYSSAMLAGFFVAPRLGSIARSDWLQSVLISAATLIPVTQLATFEEIEELTPLHLMMLAGMRNLVCVAAVFARERRQRRRCVLVGLVTVVMAFSFSGTAPVLVLSLGYLLTLVYWFACNDAQRWVDGVLPGGKLALLRATLIPGVAIPVSFVAALLTMPSDLAWDESFLDFGREDEQLTMAEVEEMIIERQNTLDEITQNTRGADASKNSAGGEADASDRSSEAGRFSTVRSSPDASRASNRQVLRVDGVSAAHLPMMTFDRFDGAHWSPELARSLASTQIADDGVWRKEVQQKALQIGQRALASGANAENFVEQARGAIRDWMAGASGEALEVSFEKLTKGDLRRFSQRSLMASAEFGHLLNQYDLEELAGDALLNAELRDELVKRMSDPNADQQQQLLAVLNAWRRRRGGGALPPELAALLGAWTRGAQSPIEAARGIESGLRSHAEHDPEALTPAGVTDSVKHFLIESRRGPDYLFASSAVVLLRAKGLPARLVSGFVAKPERYNRFNGQTSVYEDDLHYWAQVRLGPRTWVDLEPTPGYELRTEAPDPPSLTSLAIGWLGLNRPAGQIVWACALIGVFATWWFRGRLAMLTAWLAWGLSRAFTPGPRRVRAAGRLLDRRAAVAAGPRPANATRAAWLSQLLNNDNEALSAVAAYGRVSDRADFHPHGLRGADPHLIDTATRDVVTTVTLRRLRRSPSPTASTPC